MKPTIAQAIQFAVLVIVSGLPLRAQGNYEIQVYAYDTVAPGTTMVELHSNFTFEGFKTSQQGVLPDEHQTHETIEITQGWTDWFETGFYIFTSYGPIKATTGLAITSVLGFAFRRNGIGRWG